MTAQLKLTIELRFKMPYVPDELRIVYRGAVPKVKPRPGEWVKQPEDIRAQLRRFTKECREQPELATKLLRARHYRHFVVDPATSRVAPMAYAMWYGATLETLQKTEKNELRLPFVIQNARLEPASDVLIYGVEDRAWKTLNRLVPDYPISRDKITFHLIRQRCLVSADPVDPTKPLNLKSKLYPNLRRIDASDGAIVLEEVERDRLAARDLVTAAIARGKVAGKNLKRNNHFALIDAKKTTWWVFIPRRATLSNLHYLLRNVLAEALEYKYRYGRQRITINPVVLLSTPISRTNQWVVGCLNSFGILVYSHDRSDFIPEGRESQALSWLL